MGRTYYLKGWARMSRRNRNRGVVGTIESGMDVKTIAQEAADLHEESTATNDAADLDVKPIELGPAGAEWLRANGHVLHTGDQIRIAKSDDDEEPLSEAVTLYGDLEQLVDRRIATHAKRRAALERSRGRNAIADALDALAEEARGE